MFIIFGNGNNLRECGLPSKFLAPSLERNGSEIMSTSKAVSSASRCFSRMEFFCVRVKTNTFAALEQTSNSLFLDHFGTSLPSQTSVMQTTSPHMACYSVALTQGLLSNTLQVVIPSRAEDWLNVMNWCTGNFTAMRQFPFNIGHLRFDIKLV